MSSHSTLGVAALVLLVAGMADVHAYECTGMGRKYCTDEDPAHQTRTQCPRACQRDQCEGRRSTELERAGAERDSSEGGTPRWEEVAMSGEAPVPLSMRTRAPIISRLGIYLLPGAEIVLTLWSLSVDLFGGFISRIYHHAALL